MKVCMVALVEYEGLVTAVCAHLAGHAGKHSWDAELSARTASSRLRTGHRPLVGWPATKVDT